MKKTKFIRAIIAVVSVIAVFCAIFFFANPFVEGKLPFDSDCYSFILEGKEYSLPFKVSMLKANGWSINNVENSRVYLAGHGCEEFEAVKGEKKVRVLIGNPTLNEATIDDSNIVGIKFYHGSKVRFFLKNDISYDFTREQIISTFGLPDVLSAEGIENFYYTKNEEKFDKAYFYFYDSLTDNDKVGLPAVALYNFGNVVFDITRANDNEEIPYDEPVELGEDLSSGLFKIGGRIYRLPMRYADFKRDWKTVDFVTSLPANTYSDNFLLRHKTDVIEIDPFLINDAKYVDTSDDASIYGFFSDNIDIWNCDIEFPGGLNICKNRDEMINELSIFEKIGNVYKYEKDGFKLEIQYTDYGNCMNFKVSKNADKFESEGRYYSDYGKEEFFDVSGEIKESDKIKPMEKIYVPYYVPERFSMQPEKYGYKNFSNGIVYQINGFSSKIYFTQEPIVSNRKINLHKKDLVRENNGFYVNDKGFHMFFWEKDGYRFSLYSGSILKKELYQMADSLMTQEEAVAKEEEKRAPIKAKIQGKTFMEIEAVYGKAKSYFSGFFGGVYDIDGVTVTIYFDSDGFVREFYLEE